MATTGHESEHITIAGLKGALQLYKTSISDTKMNANLKGVANGVAELDANGKVPAAQLPSFVDDIIEGYFYNDKFYEEAAHTTLITGEGGKIYTDLATNKTYRWSGTAYTLIKGDLVIGTASGNAADGAVVASHTGNTTVHITAAERTAWNAKGSYSKPSGGIPKSDLASSVQTSLELADSAIQSHLDISGKADKSATVSTIAYDTTNKKITKTINGTTSDVVTVATLKTDLALTKSDVDLGNVGNFKAVSTVASQGLSSTEQANARANIGAGTSSFSGSYNDLTNKPTIPSAAANGTFSVKTKVGDASAVTAADFTANLSSADDVTFIQGDNVTLTTDTSNRTITIASTDTTYGTFGSSAAGLTPSTASGNVTTAETSSTVNYLCSDGKWRPLPEGAWKTGTITTNTHKITVGSGFKSDGTTAITATSASAAATPSVTLGDSGVTAGSYGDSAAQTPTYGGTFKVPYVTVNAKGIVTGIAEHTVTIPASDNTNTATAADNILDGSNSGTQITYAPYSTQQSKLSFDTSSTAPTRTDRLNLNGYFYATKLYSGGTEVLTAHQDISDKQAKVAKLGSTTKPLYTSAAGTFAECSTYAGGTAVTLNGTSKAANTASFYAPTAVGTSGQLLVSSGSGAPSWVSPASVQTCEDIISELT